MKKMRNYANAIFAQMVAFSCISPVFADDAPSPGPGPALQARQRLLERIQQAKGQGMGISSYMAAFKDIEERVKSGEPEDKVSARVQQIHKAVSDQIERAKILKNQKPLPPQGSQVTGGDLPDHGGPAGSKGGAPAGGAPGGMGGGIADKLKKLDSLPEPIKERLLNDPRVIEKLKERAGGGEGGGPPQAAPGGQPPGGGSPPPAKEKPQ